MNNSQPSDKSLISTTEFKWSCDSLFSADARFGLPGDSNDSEIKSIGAASAIESECETVTSKPPQLETLVSAVRVLSADAVENANSGHPGMPLGMAPTAAVLWHKHLRMSPQNPDWINRDRFILSAGHGSMLQYSLMYIFGYDAVTIDDIKTFRQLGSRACGHPENTATHGIEVMTGPLGQGISNAVGMALAESHLATMYNKADAPPVINHYTYCIAGDGCLMEGVSAESSSLAGHWQLGKLIVFWDDNSISIEGPTEIAFTENVMSRYESYGWQVLHVTDGNSDLDAIDKAIIEAKRCPDRPTIIRVTTTIGYGTPSLAGKAKAHGSCLGADEICGLRDSLNWSYKPFELPKEVADVAVTARAAGERREREWRASVDLYRGQYPELGAQFEALILRKQLPREWAKTLDKVANLDMIENKRSTRQLSHMALNALAGRLTHMFGGSADLGPSNLTGLVGCGDYQAVSRSGRNLHFGVREHGMAAIMNGVALHNGGLIPFCATFFVFSDYCRAAIRTAALSSAGVIFVMTHDSVMVGEDGPTHQPVEHLASFRAMPGVITMRPVDAVETATCYEIAIRRRDAPTLLVLTRQKYNSKPGSAIGTRHGAYIFSDSTRADGIIDVILIATGSEVAIAEGAAGLLREQGYGVRVVSMPCMEFFQNQAKSYHQKVLPKSVPLQKRLIVEAGCKFGWHEFARNFHTVDSFGASGSQDQLAMLFKLTVIDVADRARSVADEVGSDGDY